MKSLVTIFLACLTGLLVQIIWGEQPPNPLGDGRLVQLPMPPPIAVVSPPLLPAPVIQRLSQPTAPVHVSGAKLEIYDPQSGNERMAETREADQTDWGSARSLLEGPSLVLASVAEPRLVEPVPVNTPVPPGPMGEATLLPIDPANVTTETLLVSAPQIDNGVTDKNKDGSASAPRPDILTPNLYLPEGAMNEAGARLTLIRPELRIYENPDDESQPSDIVLKEGETVRPLTRLRNEKEFDWIKFEHQGREWWAQAEYFIRVDPRNHVAAGARNLPIGEEAVDKDSALPPDYSPNDLVELPRKYAFDPREYRLRSEAAQAFMRMADEAARHKLRLRVFSGYRDFEHQKKLYLEAIEKNGPKQNGTAAPGYSEHQLGTTIDVSTTDRHTVLSNRFGETPEGRWLHENAERFGFRNSYTNENTDESGYKPEPWHLRYVGLKSAKQPGIARSR